MDSEFIEEIRKKQLILERRLEFPSDVRHCIERWEHSRPDIFLQKVREFLFISDWIGADSRVGNRTVTTAAQAEVVVRFFPDVLSSEDRWGMRPIHCYVSKKNNMCLNLNNLRFIPLFAKLGIELQQFRKADRGGLVDSDCIGFQVAVLNNLLSFYDYGKDDDKNEEYHDSVDKSIVGVMEDLRKIGLFQKSDIQKYNVLLRLCTKPIFPARRFSYLVNWDPCSLERCYGNTHHLLNFAIFIDNNVSRLKIVFDAGMRHFPHRIGFIFHKGQDLSSGTAYAMACEKFGRNDIERMLEDALNNATKKDKNYGLKSLVCAASEEEIQLDGLFKLIQREPTILRRALPLFEKTSND